MKTILFFTILVFSHFFSKAQGLEKIIVEKYYVSDANDMNALCGKYLPVGSVTYRIFLDLLPDYRFQAVYGSQNHELRISTTTSFFNYEDYGDEIPNVIPDRLLDNSIVMLDSWLSAGGASEGNLGIPKSDDDEKITVMNQNGFLQNADPAAGIPLKTRDGLISGDPPRVTIFGIDSIIKIFGKHNTDENGQSFYTTNGSWACLKGSQGPTHDNKVLIGQFTTNGVFSFKLNVQIGTPAGTREQYVAENAYSDEKQFAGLIYSSDSMDTSKFSKPPVKNPATKK